MNIHSIENYGTIETYVDDRLVVTHRRAGDIPGCTPPVHVKSLLEEGNLKTREQEDKNNTFADQYAQACRDYLDGKLTGNDTWVTWKNIVDRIGRLT